MYLTCSTRADGSVAAAGAPEGMAIGKRVLMGLTEVPGAAAGAPGARTGDTAAMIGASPVPLLFG